ncbi:unnamed protein product, partial [Ectocarpus fasciculatus]
AKRRDDYCCSSHLSRLPKPQHTGIGKLFFLRTAYEARSKAARLRTRTTSFTRKGGVSLCRLAGMGRLRYRLRRRSRLRTAAAAAAAMAASLVASQEGVDLSEHTVNRRGQAQDQGR